MVKIRIKPEEYLRFKKERKKIAKIPTEGQFVAVVRVRGTVNIRRDLALTLKMLRLNRPNHAVVVSLTKEIKGMLLKVNNLIAWGEIDLETFIKLLKERGRVIGNKRLTDEEVVKRTEGKFKTIEDLAKAIWSKKIHLRDVTWLKPVFRLRPPKGGYRGTVKKSFFVGGSVGYWGDRIKILLNHML